MTIGNPAFCLVLHLTGVHFRGELQHVSVVSEQKINCGQIRTREIGGVRLQDELYAKQKNFSLFCLFVLPNKRGSHRRHSVKKLSLKIWQNSTESTCAGVTF